MDNKENIGIQFDEFSLSYFEISPIWEFAIDEEGEEEKDETTLKPRFDLSLPDPAEGLLIVECEFETNSGNKFRGLCTPSFDDSISSILPYIVSDNQFTMFWFGIVKPDKQTKDKIYEALSETADSLFPLKFQSKLAKADGSRISGKIEGFMWMRLSDDLVTTEK